MERYYTNAKELLHFEGGHIADCGDSEMAHFLAAAANAFKHPELPTGDADAQPEFDCAGKAEREGQPKPFTLIASDPLAPWLVDIWAAMSRGDVPGALGAFYGMIDTNLLRYATDPRSPAKLDSAELIANDMRNWRIEKGLK